MASKLTMVLVLSGFLSACATENGPGKHEQTPGPQTSSPGNQEPPPSSPPAPAGGISSSGDEAPCSEAPSVIGKTFTHPVLDPKSCEEMIASGTEVSCDEQIAFVNETHADVLLGASDIMDRVPFFQSGNCIRIDLSQSATYQGLNDKRSSWRLTGDGALVSSVDGTEFKTK